MIRFGHYPILIYDFISENINIQIFYWEFKSIGAYAYLYVCISSNWSIELVFVQVQRKDATLDIMVLEVSLY